MPTLFVDDLTNIDCSILDPERGLIGASWTVDIELSGELDEQSMVFDFSKAKKTIKTIIDRDVDHKLLIPGQYSGLIITESENADPKLDFTDINGEHIEHKSPTSAICKLASRHIENADIINYLNERIMQELPNNVEALRMTLREESVPGNYFRYSHGLKKHDGNCQRIAHGHRSQIQIWQNQKRSSELERQLAKRWHDIYLGTADDVINETDDRVRFSYATEQGSFIIELNKSRVHMLPQDSTVECIAAHVLELISQQSQAPIKVKAFEGIGKGAIAQNY